MKANDAARRYAITRGSGPLHAKAKHKGKIKTWTAKNGSNG
jgi:hypothetical protein